MKIIPTAAALLLLAPPGAMAGEQAVPIPYHELVGMYENCLESASPKFPVDQQYIAKSLCLCQTEAFSREKTYGELAELARSPGAFNGAADGYMEACVARIQDEINPAK
jgi:hypothetical protein